MPKIIEQSFETDSRIYNIAHRNHKPLGFRKKYPKPYAWQEIIENLEKDKTLKPDDSYKREKKL